MSEQVIRRVQYYDGQYLRLGEFTDEQSYHIGMRRRHNLAGHSWGIVRGLYLDFIDRKPKQDFGREPVVQPGMALDGYGRELVAANPLPIDTAQFDFLNTDALDIWLTYGLTSSDAAPEGYGDCRTDTGDYNRRIEQPTLVYTEADPSAQGRRAPDDVPSGNLDFGPERTPPDDLQESWHVFLGRVRREQVSPDRSSDYRYFVNNSGRPYAGLVGQAIFAPSGRALVQVGEETSSIPNRFAVFVSHDVKPEPTTSNGTSKSSTPSDGQTGTQFLKDPNLEVDSGGDIVFRGETTLYGDLTLQGGAVQFRGLFPEEMDGNGGQPVNSTVQANGGQFAKGQTPSLPPPWIIYKVVRPDPTATPRLSGDGKQDSTTTQNAQPVLHELRVVIGNDVQIQDIKDDKPTGKTKLLPSQLAVGAFDKDKQKFISYLTVSNQKVVVNGDLVVNGMIIQAQGVVAGTLTPQAQAQVTAAYVSGLTGRGTSPVNLSASALEALKVMLADPAGREGVLKFLKDSNLIAPMVQLLIADENGAKALVESFPDANP